MDQGSTRKRSDVHNFAPTVTKFCVMWEGQALPHDTKFGNCRCEIVGTIVIFIWSLIPGSSWSGLIKAELITSHRLLTEPQQNIINFGNQPLTCFRMYSMVGVILPDYMRRYSRSQPPCRLAQRYLWQLRDRLSTTATNMWQIGWDFADDIFKFISLNWKWCILIKISLKMFPRVHYVISQH